MTKKDQTTSENIDLGRDEKEDVIPSASDKKRDSHNKASDEIKNAHAAGDGAYGRSDKSIFAGDEHKNEEQENDPAY